MPLDNWRVAFRGMTLYPGYRASARLVRGLLRYAVSARAAVSRPQGRAPFQWSLGERLRPIVPQAAAASAVFAPDDAQWRATLLMMDGAGRPLAFVKYAQSPEGLRLLRNEAHVLSHLPAGLGPELLQHAPFGAGEILVQTVVGGRPCLPRLALGAPQREFLRALAASRQSETIRAAQHPLVLRHLQTEGPHRAVLERVISALDVRTWRTVLMHGDFTFANTRELDGRCTAFDWEWSVENGFPNLDAAEWLIRVARGIQHLTPPVAARRITPVLASALDAPDREYAGALAALAAIHSAALWFAPNRTAPDKAGWLLDFAHACLKEGGR